MILSGRIWCFGENMNTDLMYPAGAFRATPEERMALVFSANRPGWSSLVKVGDMLVAGRNFGTGSGRPASSVLVDLGIRGIVAESVNGLFQRNCVNAGLPVVECPTIMESVTEGDVITVDFATGTVTLPDKSVKVGAALPGPLLDIVASGGILERLRKDGYI